MDYGENPEVTIDWGDGTVEEVTGSNVDESNRVEHTYSKTNGATKITITGKCDSIGMGGQDKLVEIEKWGDTGSSSYRFTECSNLTKMAKPEANTFKNVTTFREVFIMTRLTAIPEGMFDSCPNITDFYLTFLGCENLVSIPEGLFDNCPDVTNFEGTFYGCSNLESIPENLFDKCQKVESFNGTFAHCDSLTGLAIPLWERVKDGESNEYKGTPSGKGCYYNCTQLTNYDEIPEYWKQSYSSYY